MFCDVPVFVMIFNTVVLCFASRVGHIVLLCSLVYIHVYIYSNTPLYRPSLYAHDVGGIDGLAV